MIRWANNHKQRTNEPTLFILFIYNKFLLFKSCGGTKINLIRLKIAIPTFFFCFYSVDVGKTNKTKVHHCSIYTTLQKSLRESRLEMRKLYETKINLQQLKFFLLLIKIVVTVVQYWNFIDVMSDNLIL